MGLLDSFWHKKKESEDLGASESNLDDREPNFSPLPERDLQPNFPDFKLGKPIGLGSQENVTSRDIELILSKLELINRKLDEIDKRVQFIEKVAKDSR